MASKINTVVERTCKGCGTNIPRLKFCSSDCRVDWYKRTGAARALARARAAGARPIEQVKAERREAALRICQECNGSFLPSGYGNLSRYCSKPCAFAEARRRASVRADAAMYTRWARLAVRAARPTGKQCRTCGEAVGKYVQRCERCRDIANLTARKRSRLTPSYRASKARRRAMERGRADGAELFDPIEILSRDGWRCHICGCLTPKRLRGTYHDRAPELDHIHPLAKGGKHTRLNTACACRKCNGAKGAEPLGQLRLVA